MREIFHSGYQPRRSGRVHLSGFSDRGFEQFVFDRILHSLANQDGELIKCRVDLTPRSADRGRDVTIKKFTANKLLDFQYADPKPQTIIAECKLVGGQRLDFEHIAPNVLQLESSGTNIFLLITNATLTPRSLSLIEEHCERVGAHLHLIDAYNFDRHFPGIGEYSDSVDDLDDRSTSTADHLQISYQAFPDFNPDGIGFTVHVAVRSFGHRSVEIGIGLHSTRDWTVTGLGRKLRPLYGDDLACFTFRLAPKRGRVKRTVKLALTIDGRPDLFEVKLSNSDDLVDLPLFGDSMIRIVESYFRRLRAGLAPHILHLHAPSGTGKTRFLTEIARRVGFVSDVVVWFRLRDDGTAIVQAVNQKGQPTKSLHTITQEEMLRQLRSQVDSISRPDLIFIDDLHVATSETIDAMESIVFEPREHPHLILCGRSDSLFRQARYEAFARLLKENGSSPHQERLDLADLTNAEVTGILQALLPGQAVGALSAPTHTTTLRPVDLVHFIHSLLERGFIYWIDENKLAVQYDKSNDINVQSLTSVLTSEILEYRYEYLDTIGIDGFMLSDVFALLGLIDNPELTFTVLERLRSEHGIPFELLAYWFEEENSAHVAFLAHDTIKEFLSKRFYRFDRQRTLGRIFQYFPEINQHLSPLKLAAIRLHERDFKGALPAIAKVARRLRAFKNISSLALEDVAYEDLSSLMFLLTHRPRACPTVLCRALIARAYLNIHSRDFVDGFLDCINLLTLIDGLDRTSSTAAMRLAVRQLLAHGLLNSGDLRTALTLMHEVENSIQEMAPSPTAWAVEFDMCDRLQTYYMQQSAFELARSFLFRGRTQAYRTGDQALINLSLSAEFHLHRYLDAEEALRMAIRQRVHADDFAPHRLKLHAEVNEAVARWATHGTIASSGTIAFLDHVRSISELRGFGHLVPRIDYLKALDAYHRFEYGEGEGHEVDALISKTQQSALRYGYGEYNWLSENLRLLHKITMGLDAIIIENLANRIVNELSRNGLTFIAEDYLCYQNVVVLSNALRAIYIFTDEAKAWSVAEQISFSPLLSLTKENRERRLSAVFQGGLLCQKYDSRAVAIDRQGYFTILV